MALGSGGGGGAKGVRMGQAHVELSAKDGISAALKRVGQRFVEFGRMALMATGVGGVIGGALGALSIKDTLDDLGKVSDVAKAFGITGKAASGLFGVLEQAGGEFKENLEGVIQFSDTVQQAMNGMEGQGAKLFDGLAIKAKELEGLAVDEQFYRVHAAIRELPQPLQEAKLALLGGTDSMKQWQRLLSMSSEEVRQIAADSAISTKELEEAATASRELQRAGSAVNRVWQQTVIMLAPYVTQLATMATAGLKQAAAWMKGRTLRDVWDELVALGNRAWVEVSTRARDTWSDVQDWFTSGWDSAVRYTRDLFADLAVGITGLLTDAFKASLGFLTGGVRNAARIVAAFDKQAGQQLGNGIAAVEVGLGLDADRVKAAVKAAADGVKDAARQEQELNAEARRLAKLEREAKSEQERADAGANLARVRAEIELRRAARIEEEQAAARQDKLKKKLNQIDRSVGTFGAGQFYRQAFGRQSSDGVRDELKKGNAEAKKQTELLGKIENKVGPPVITR